MIRTTVLSAHMSYSWPLTPGEVMPGFIVVLMVPPNKICTCKSSNGCKKLKESREVSLGSSQSSCRTPLSLSCQSRSIQPHRLMFSLNETGFTPHRIHVCQMDRTKLLVGIRKNEKRRIRAVEGFRRQNSQTKLYIVL